MDPISNADRLALVLRQRLLERARRQEGASKAERSTQQSAAAKSLQLEGLLPRERRRALIGAILLAQLGQELMNEARFHQVVVRVCEVLEDDPETLHLIDAALSETLRAD